MDAEAIIVAPELQAEFDQFITTGEASISFLTRLESDQELQRAVDVAFERQVAALRKLGEMLSKPAAVADNTVISLEKLNGLLKHAKAANNYLRFPELTNDSESTPGLVVMVVTANRLYAAIVALEDELRANGGLEWHNDRWMRR